MFLKGLIVKRIGFLAAFSLALTTATTVLADGQMSAVSFQPFPQGSTLLVRPLDNSEHNLVLQKDFERILRKQGYTVSKDAVLILTFETRDTAGSWSGGGTNRLVELSNNHDQTGIEAPQVRLNLFNSARGGLLNPDRREPTRTVTPSSFRIDVTIDDKSNGKRLWQGWSSADIGPGDNRNLTRTMIPVLVNGLGRTVSHKVFQLQ